MLHIISIHYNKYKVLYPSYTSIFTMHWIKLKLDRKYAKKDKMRGYAVVFVPSKYINNLGKLSIKNPSIARTRLF